MSPRLPLWSEVDQEFRQGAVILQAPPTRFYLNLTEACNIACTHCITAAPEKTKDGSARVMSAAVLERLAPHLAHATYVGLTHAGEPITAPLFEPLLRTLARVAPDAPRVVHVLSNGRALTLERFARATTLGVSSWSISLDGMSAATHDVVRIGSRIERLLERVQALAELRRRDFPGVRLGIAWTLGRTNVGELLELVRFAAGAGLDWVKLEEVAPVNEAARALAELPLEARRRAVREAAALAERLGLPLLDHTEEVHVWKCHPDDRPMMRFARGDDWVNRMEINPCRLPHEVVCVEPDGAVKPVSFHHLPAGNLLEQDLLELWRSPIFVLERTRARLRRLCGGGPITCPPDPGPAAW